MSAISFEHFTVRGCLLSALLVMGAGCSGDMDDLHAYMDDVKARPGGRIEPLPQISSYDSFAYEAQLLRPPFTPDAPTISVGEENGVRPDDERNREFLEQFPLDTLRLVGTLEMGQNVFGLIQTNDGLIHRVLPGNFIGQNDGKIESISASEVTLTEIVPDGLGGYIERPASVAISD